MKSTIINVIIISISILLSVFIYVSYNRYEMIAINQYAYRVDKLTGEIRFYIANKWQPAERKY